MRRHAFYASRRVSLHIPDTTHWLRVLSRHRGGLNGVRHPQLIDAMCRISATYHASTYGPTISRASTPSPCTKPTERLTISFRKLSSKSAHGAYLCR